MQKLLNLFFYHNLIHSEFTTQSKDFYKKTLKEKYFLFKNINVVIKRYIFAKDRL